MPSVILPNMDSTFGRWILDGLVRQFEVHTVDRAAGESRAPEPAMLVEEWSKLQASPMSFGRALRNRCSAEEQIDCCAPAVVRKGIGVHPLVADAEHAVALHRCD